MARDDLCIAVPSFFKCPISLDVMKSPVSLCTGVSYDRSSIQRWLDSGNNTCPATMQVLHSKEFVPNRTLQRLIQTWSESVRQQQPQPQPQRGHSRVESAANLVPSRDEITRLVKCLESAKQEKCCGQSNCLSELVRFANESEENREFLAKMDGLVPMLVDFLGDGVDDNAGNAACKAIDVIEDVVRVLDMMLTNTGDRHGLMTLLLKTMNCRNNDPMNCFITSLLLVLQQGSADSRIGSVRILESMAVDPELKLLIARSDELLGELVKSISLESDPSLIEASLSCLIAISMPKCVKVKLVHQKTVAESRNLLTWSDATVSMTEKALKLLETLSSCKEGREEMCGDPACVEAVVRKAVKVSGGDATEHAVTVLWSLCYLFRDQRAQEAVARSNGLTKFLLLMQSNCSPAVRQMSADLLKIFRRVNSKFCLSSYDTKTIHIMPF